MEGDAGAPVTLDEVMEIEGMLDEVWQDLSASAQAVIDKQGVAYTDQEGDLVTSIETIFNFRDFIEGYRGSCITFDTTFALTDREVTTELLRQDLRRKQHVANLDNRGKLHFLV